MICQVRSTFYTAQSCKRSTNFLRVFIELVRNSTVMPFSPCVFLRVANRFRKKISGLFLWDDVFPFNRFILLNNKIITYRIGVLIFGTLYLTQWRISSFFFYLLHLPVLGYCLFCYDVRPILRACIKSVLENCCDSITNYFVTWCLPDNRSSPSYEATHN